MSGFFGRIKQVFLHRSDSNNSPAFKIYNAIELKMIALKTRMILQKIMEDLLRAITRDDQQFTFAGQDPLKIYNIMQVIGEKVIEAESIRILMEMMRKVEMLSPQIILTNGDISLLRNEIQWFQCVLWYRKSRQVGSLDDLYYFCLDFFKGVDITAELNINCQVFQMFPVLKYLQKGDILPLHEILFYIQPYVSCNIDQTTLDNVFVYNKGEIQKQVDERQPKKHINHPSALRVPLILPSVPEQPKSNIYTPYVPPQNNNLSQNTNPYQDNPYQQSNSGNISNIQPNSPYSHTNNYNNQYNNQNNQFNSPPFNNDNFNQNFNNNNQPFNNNNYNQPYNSNINQPFNNNNNQPFNNNNNQPFNNNNNYFPQPNNNNSYSQSNVNNFAPQPNRSNNFLPHSNINNNFNPQTNNSNIPPQPAINNFMPQPNNSNFAPHPSNINQGNMPNYNDMNQMGANNFTYTGPQNPKELPKIPQYSPNNNTLNINPNSPIPQDQLNNNKFSPQQPSFYNSLMRNNSNQNKNPIPAVLPTIPSKNIQNNPLYDPNSRQFYERQNNQINFAQQYGSKVPINKQTFEGFNDFNYEQQIRELQEMQRQQRLKKEEEEQRKEAERKKKQQREQKQRKQRQQKELEEQRCMLQALRIQQLQQQKNKKDEQQRKQQQEKEKKLRQQQERREREQKQRDQQFEARRKERENEWQRQNQAQLNVFADNQREQIDRGNSGRFSSGFGMKIDFGQDLSEQFKMQSPDQVHSSILRFAKQKQQVLPSSQTPTFQAPSYQASSSEAPVTNNEPAQTIQDEQQSMNIIRQHFQSNSEQDFKLFYFKRVKAQQ